jgi:hypothetical protein
MIKVPSYLYSKEIINKITSLIKFKNSEDFDSLPNKDKDYLISHAMKNCEYDAEIILSSDTNKMLSDYLSSYDHKYLYEFNKSAINDSYEFFSPYLNQIFYDLIEEIESYKFRDNGFVQSIDRQTGEPTWIRA